MQVHRSRDQIVLGLGEAEAAMLHDLIGHVRDLLIDETEDDEVLWGLTGSAPGGRQLPTDPVLARLLPDAHREDPSIAASHRDLTEASLRADKRDAAEQVLAVLPARGGTVALTREDAGVWLQALNDVRLMMGVELDVTEETEPPAEVHTPQEIRLAVYFWLTHLQDTLVEAVLR